jgi:dihydrofolate reductase
MIGIVAVNNLGFIGIGDRMLWNCTDDLRHFKKMTLNKKVLVGYNTFSELPNLPNREVILDLRENYNFDVDFVIGGKKTYEKYSPYFTELHISHIDDNSIGDVTFPNLTNLNKDCKIFNYNFTL